MEFLESQVTVMESNVPRLPSAVKEKARVASKQELRNARSRSTDIDRHFPVLLATRQRTSSPVDVRFRALFRNLADCTSTSQCGFLRPPCTSLLWFSFKVLPTSAIVFSWPGGCCLPAWLSDRAVPLILTPLMSFTTVTLSIFYDFSPLKFWRPPQPCLGIHKIYLSIYSGSHPFYAKLWTCSCWPKTYDKKRYGKYEKSWDGLPSSPKSKRGQKPFGILCVIP